MIRRAVISLAFGQSIVGYLQERPAAAGELLETITGRIEASKRIRLDRHQVLFVLGKLDEKENNFWKCRSIAWDQFYYVDRAFKVSTSTDDSIRRIVKKAADTFLNAFHEWEVSDWDDSL